MPVCFFLARRYHRVVVERARLYIERGIWHGIQLSNLEGWLQNFRADEEKYLAACLLDGFIYRSRPQIESMYKYLFSVLFPNYARKARLPLITPTTAFYAPLSTGLPGKSEHIYFRILNTTIRLPQRQQVTVTVDFLNRKPKQPIVLIDDFCGTGDSFDAFSKKFNISSFPEVRFIFCPLIAHEDGVSRINQTHNNVTVLGVEQLSKGTQTFCKESFIFTDPDAARQYYSSFVSNLGITSNQFPLGYGQQELALAFEESIPNETLPIFWSDKMNCPLVRRR